LTYKLRWSDPLGDRLAVYFREADSLFFSRFFSFFKNTPAPESIAASFQLTGQKVAYEFWTDQGSQKKQNSKYLDEGCSASDSSNDRSFAIGGMHYLAQDNLFSSLETLSSKSETLPLLEGQQVCQNLYAPDSK
jgi:hypothetical protein